MDKLYACWKRKRAAIESIGRYLPSIAPLTMAEIIVTASDTFDLVPRGSRARRKIGGDALQSTTYGTSPIRADSFHISRDRYTSARKIIDERALAVRKILKPIAVELSYCAFGIRNFQPATIISYTVA